MELVIMREEESVVEIKGLGLKATEVWRMGSK